MKLANYWVALIALSISANATAETAQSIQKKMNNVLTNCHDNLQVIAGEFYSGMGYFPGSDLDLSAQQPYARQAEFEALENIINRCMNSKFVGGDSYIKLTEADLVDWESALTTDTIKISYPSITVEINGEEELVQGMQMDVLLGGAKKRPNGSKTQNISNVITNGLPSKNGKVSFLLTSNNYTNGGALSYCGYQVDEIGFNGITSTGNVLDKHFPRRCQASSNNPFINKDYAIKNRMNDIILSCGSYSKVAIGEFHADRGYLPGTNNATNAQRASKDLLQTVVNNCMLSKYVGGEFVSLDLTYDMNWDGTLASSNTVVISYPEKSAQGSDYTVNEAIQLDVSIGGSEFMPTGERVLDISNKITSGNLPSENGKISFVIEVLEDDGYVVGYQLLCGAKVASAGYPNKTTVKSNLLPNSCK